MTRISRRMIAVGSLACLVWATAALAQSFPYKWLSTVSTNSELVNAGATRLTVIVPLNTTTTLYYLKLYDKATAPTCGTDTPVQTFPVPFGGSNAGGGIALPLPPGGLSFQNGLGFCLTGGIADNDAANAAAGVAINLGWQRGP